MNKRVLIIEDDPEIVELLAIHLRDLDCEIFKVHDGRLGYLQASEEVFDLIILDLMLPSMNGMDVCQKLRTQRINTPILMLTAKSEEIDKILGLEMGADDYLTKPFSVREFIARVKAIFRRVKMTKEEGSTALKKKLHYGNLEIDVEMRKVLLNNQRIELTPKEFDLLYLMASNPGKSYSRQRILRLVWGYEYNGYEHTVNSHINRLRAKIEPDINNPTYILTTWGVGYRFSDE
ncbi:MAG: response regulator transcription factor [Chitinophagales bacterium]